jgi:SAM-dependent methyltransferase
MNCRICSGGTKDSYILHSGRNNISVPTFYCPACGAYFSDGGPVNYNDSHDGNVELTAYYLQYELAIRARYQRIFTFIESQVSPGRFLDIGSGMGFSLDVANQRGWLTTGMEPNSALVNHAKGRGLIVTQGYLSYETTGEYDFLLIDNVLEHILQPADFLRQAVRLTATSGIILIAVPPMDWLRKWLGAISYVRNRVTVPQLNIFGEVDQHVNIFSRKAMDRLLQSVGLRLLDIRFHHSFVYNNALFRGLSLEDGYYFAVRA